MIYSVIIFFGIIISGLLVIRIKVSDSKLRLLLAFGGSFILSITFLEIIPEIYSSGVSVYAGLFMIVGFLIQLFVDFLTKGADHGHKHHTEIKGGAKTTISYVPLLIGVFIHSFIEAMPLTDFYGSTEVKNSMVTGIVIHNIPISIVLTGLFISNGYSRLKTVLLLVIFAIAAPAGILFSSQLGFLFSEEASLFYIITMSVVVGIFLHISTTVLFEAGENHRFNIYKLLVILIAIMFAIFITQFIE